LPLRRGAVPVPGADKLQAGRHRQAGATFAASGAAGALAVEDRPGTVQIRDRPVERVLGKVLCGAAPISGRGLPAMSRRVRQATLRSAFHIAFESADNEVVLVSRLGDRTVGKAPKAAIAAAILDEVERLLDD
jgi:hypothetical protein